MPQFFKKLKLYLELTHLLSSLSSSSNKVFFTAIVSHGTTGSFVKSITLSKCL